MSSVAVAVHSDERPLRSNAKVIDDVVNDNGVVAQEVALDDEVVLPLQAHGAANAVTIPEECRRGKAAL